MSVSEIVSAAIPLFIVSALTFYLFFFNVPLWTAREMGELASNGVYKFVFTAIGTVGDGIYKFVETVTNAITSTLHLRKHGRLAALINLFLFMFAIVLCQSVYEYILSSALNAESADLHFANETFYNAYLDIQLFYGLARNVAGAEGFKSLGDAIGSFIFGFVIYVGITLAYFAVLFSLLTNKCQDLNLVDKYLSWTPVYKLMNFEPDKQKLSSIPRKLASDALGFVNDLTMIVNFKIPGVQFMFCTLLGIYSVVRAFLGERADASDLVASLMDVTNVMDTIVSFIIGFVIAKMGAILGRMVYRVLPENVQSILHNLSTVAGNMSDNIRLKRRKWAKQHDSVWPNYEPVKVRKMVLDPTIEKEV